MKLEGEYAVDKKQRIHRIASLVVLLIWFFLIWHNSGLPYAIRGATVYAFPLAIIWFPEPMSRYSGLVLGRGRHIDQPSHPVILRWAGWFLLLFVPLFIIVIGLMSEG